MQVQCMKCNGRAENKQDEREPYISTTTCSQCGYSQSFNSLVTYDEYGEMD